MTADVLEITIKFFADVKVFHLLDLCKKQCVFKLQTVVGRCSKLQSTAGRPYY